jgi:prepilin-type processing-associated H-X9-DG protein
MSTPYEFSPEPPEPSKRTLKCSEVALLSLVVPVFLAVLLPSLLGPRDRHLRALCANNLSQLYKLTQVRGINHRKTWPKERGEALWLALRTSNPPLIDESEIEILFYPVKGEDPADGCTDYRGPANDLRSLRAGDPLGADKVGNHGKGGNVLLADGSVLERFEDDPEWRRSADLLRP